MTVKRELANIPKHNKKHEASHNVQCCCGDYEELDKANKPG